ncbi:MAG TPA: hypothetical protein PLO23_09140 [Alphaproteobacteria bacterium]|nr:hypothetical protein [Alphaproteobacteria bacterium]
MYYPLHRALNLSSLKQAFVQAMQKAWCAQTAWEGLAESYDSKLNPARGQCLVTVLAAWADLDFRDRIVPALARPDSRSPSGEWHFFLNHVRPGFDLNIDPTVQQYGWSPDVWALERVSLENALHMEVICGSFFEAKARESLERRLSLFIERLESEGGYKLAYSAADILARVDHVFSYARPTSAQTPAAPVSTTSPAAGL